MSVNDLRPTIINILEHSDLTQISAKGVRNMLSQQYASRIPHGVDLDGSHKKEVTTLIKECFRQLNPPPPPPPDAAGLSLPGAGGVRGGLPSEVQAPKKKASSSKKRAAPADEDNDKPPPSSSKRAAAPAKKAPRKKKAPVDPETKKKRAANPNNPFNRPMILDAPLREVCGVDEAPRYAIVKHIWTYIKGNKLQDPNNGRKIICDERLTALFNKPTVDSFEFVKLLGQHISPKPIPEGGFPITQPDGGDEQAESSNSHQA